MDIRVEHVGGGAACRYLLALSEAEESEMAGHQRLNPDGLLDSKSWGYHQVQISTGTRIVHFAGQAALDREANVVGEGDFRAQMAACLANIDLACAAAAVARQDIASLRLYVVNHQAELVPTMIELLTGFFGADHTPPATLIGVACLARPELLIEIEAVAIG
jgi:enamine deaminase RidA (YjgF/YER057c/UK114 family)